MDGGDLPTRDEWIKEQEAKNSTNRERPAPRESHILQGRK